MEWVKCEETKKRPGDATIRSLGVRPGQDRSISPRSEGPLDDTIDPRSSDDEATIGPIEDLINLPVDDKEPTKVLKLRKNLPEELRKAISTFLKDNLDIFAWKHSDIERIDPKVMCHHLNLYSDKKSIR